MEVAVEKYQTPNGKKIMDDIDKILEDIDLPSNEQLKRETAGALTKKLHQDPAWRKKWTTSLKNKEYTDTWRKNQKAGILKKRQDPEWIKNQKEGWKKRSQNAKWKKNHLKAMQRRSQNPIWQKEQKERNQAKGIKCQIKEPGKKWKTFDTFSEAARHYEWNNLITHPENTLPLDGSIKQWTAGKHKGWQTRRIVK